MKIQNASAVPLNQSQGSVPDFSGAMTDYYQQMTFELVSKSVVGFDLREVGTLISFLGVIQPFSSRQLMMKPEGQRAWSWYRVHANIACQLKPDDIITYLGSSYRVMQQWDYALYGYVEYDLVKDYTGSEPST